MAEKDLVFVHSDSSEPSHPEWKEKSKFSVLEMDRLFGHERCEGQDYFLVKYEKIFERYGFQTIFSQFGIF